MKELEREIDDLLLELDDEVLLGKMDFKQKIKYLVVEFQALHFENLILNIGIANGFNHDDIEHLAELIEDAGEKLDDKNLLSEDEMDLIIESVKKRSVDIKKKLN